MPTKDDVLLNLPAGDVLDAYIAAAAGWVFHRDEDDWDWDDEATLITHWKNPMGVWKVRPAYSTNPADALTLAADLPHIKLQRWADRNRWRAHVWCGNPLSHDQTQCACLTADAETLPLAVCRVWLLWRERGR